MAVIQEVECANTGDLREYWVILRTTFERRRPKTVDNTVVDGKTMSGSVDVIVQDIETAIWGAWANKAAYDRAKARSADSGVYLSPPPGSNLFIISTEREIFGDEQPCRTVAEAYALHKPLSAILANGIDA
jgi:hypothetical protein